MKKYSMWIGLGALALMCAGYLGVVRYGEISEQKQEEAKEAAKIYLTSDSPPARIGYSDGNLTVMFAKAGTGEEADWTYEADPDFPVEDSQVDGLASAAQGLTAVRDLGEAESLEEYGLADPAYTVTAADESGTETVLEIGDQTEGGEYYAKKSGENRVYTIGSGLISKLTGSLYDWVELENFPNLTADHLTEITISRNGETEYYKKPEDQETEASSEETSEDQETGSQWPDAAAANLAVLSVDSCVSFKPSEEELTNFGLSQPQVVLAYSYQSGEESGTVTLEIGNETEDGAYYYTRFAGSDLVNLISKDSLDKCLETAAE